ncbi:MAG: F0F1 ATP synthase subunit epsilon [Streptococcaceae bacterium]|jgi:F-type H+-transporting ATPase subunit epsilon|nr:F0F1 ATP synthase subunit epsilon [Streptococcaceae bacterium]
MAVMTVNVVTPAGLVYTHHSLFIVVRVEDGELGILPNHEALIASLVIDEVKVKRVDSAEHVDYIAVNGGIIEVQDNLVTIVADSAERDRNIDVSRAQRAKNRAEKMLELSKTKQDTDQLKRVEIDLHRAINRINVSKHFNL